MEPFRGKASGKTGAKGSEPRLPSGMEHTGCEERIAELEAELAETTGDRDKWVIEAKKDHDYWSGEFYRMQAQYESECKRRYACEAEVERLRHLGGAPPGVSPSPPPSSTQSAETWPKVRFKERDG